MGVLSAGAKEKGTRECMHKVLGSSFSLCLDRRRAQCWLTDEFLRDGISSPHSERLGRNLERGRGLLALVFGASHPPRNVFYQLQVKLVFVGNLLRAKPVLNDALENHVQHFVRRQRVLIGLVGLQFSRRRFFKASARDAFTLSVDVSGQGVNHRLGNIGNDGEPPPCRRRACSSRPQVPICFPCSGPLRRVCLKGPSECFRECAPECSPPLRRRGALERKASGPGCSYHKLT